MPLSGLEEIEQHVVSWGTHASVIEPQELRERLAKVARELWQRYAWRHGSVEFDNTDCARYC